MRERYDEVVRIKARMFVPKENPIFVAFLILLVLIGFRYYYEGYQHRNKRRRLLENEAVRRRIKKKMLSEGKKLRIRNNTLHDDISDLMLIEAVKELNIKVPGGFKGRPSIYEVVVSVPSIPGSWAHRVYYGIRWMVKYELLHQQFDDSDKEYLTFKALGLTEKDWKQLSEEEKNRYLQRDLWKRKNIAKKD
ncbi:hypothetical protein MHBO_002418 [Bonamia ostreae]|uniref:Uncharacterized protein n=1 Tax=Bonamia ostreae TaxID=126728 RepID=A0ABV2AN82_9EUKA